MDGQRQKQALRVVVANLQQVQPTGGRRFSRIFPATVLEQANQVIRWALVRANFDNGSNQYADHMAQKAVTLNFED